MDWELSQAGMRRLQNPLSHPEIPFSAFWAFLVSRVIKAVAGLIFQGSIGTDIAASATHGRGPVGIDAPSHTGLALPCQSVQVVQAKEVFDRICHPWRPLTMGDLQG